MRQIIVFVCAFIAIASQALADIETGLIQYEQGNFEGAIKTFTPLAQDGDVRAQFLLGTVLLSIATDEPRAEEAVNWLTRAAEQGHVEAQMELARIYRYGDGVSVNESEMVKWYRRAAEQGDVGAQLLVADAYAYGQGVEPDYVQAYMWYEIAMRFWGDLAVHARDLLAEKMSSEQIEQAVRLAHDTQVPAAQ